MSVHSYIGARYVPRFMGTYDPTQIYEALDVVDNGSGTSYIARDTVPAGTPLTDTTHWFVYGASSGAIIALQNDMIQAQNDILGLQSDVDVIEKKVNRSVIIITDSYGYRINNDGDTFIDIFADLTGLDSDHLYVGKGSGASFVNATPSLKFLSLLQGISAVDDNAITDIVVVGGANDAFSSKADNITAINTFLAYAKTTYPNANVYIFPVGLTFTSTGMNNGKYKGYDAYKDCAKNGLHWIENAEYILRNTKLLGADLCHPNEDGVNAIGSQLVNWFTGAGVDVSYINLYPAASSLISAKLSNGTAISVATGNDALTNMSRNNGTVSLQSGNAKAIRLFIDGTTPFDINMQAGFDLDFSDTLDAGNSAFFPMHNVTIYNSTTGLKTYAGYAYWQVTTTEKRLKVRTLQSIPASDGATYIDLYFDSAGPA